MSKSKRRINRAFCTSAAALAVGLLGNTPALAQAREGEQGTDDETPPKNEILVTATRREESLQDVPLSITALTGEQLEQAGAFDLQGYIQAIPGVSLIELGPGQNRVAIRGLNNIDPNTAATVGYLIDDVPQAANAQSDLELFDIERVEVLRGPQGTLFGEGSLGGTIRIITNKPDLNDIQALVHGEISDTAGASEANYAVRGMINLPIVTDAIAMRVTAYKRYNAGWFDNVGLGIVGANDTETTGGRAHLLIAPTDRWDILLTASTQELTRNGRQGRVPALGEFSFSTTIEEPVIQNTDQFSGTINYQFPWATLTSTTSYLQRDQVQENELDLAVALFVNEIDIGFDVFTQELRLVSPGDQFINWTIGGFYSDRNDNLLQDILFLTPLPPAFEIGDSLFQLGAKENRTQKAVFGEVTIEPVNFLEITLGGRWFNEKLTFRDEIADRGNVTEDEGFNPRFAIALLPSDNVNLYASAARGFRSGGNIRFGGAPGIVEVPQSFESDSAWTYEVGAKTSWLDNRLIANMSAYITDWSNIQVPFLFSFTDENGIDSSAVITQNGGRATSRGFELELQLRPTERFTVSANAGHVDATLDDAIPQIGAMEGDNIPGVRNWNASMSAVYAFQLGAGTVTMGASHTHTSKARVEFQSGAASTTVPAIDLTSVNLAYSTGRWEVRVFADNVFDNQLRVANTFDGLEVLTRGRRFGASLTFAY